ncbi:hypothetical protein PRZ48_011956 [Zasmidium cellare]|uniref:BTB domain-containing protein n=1 Tax=Zasmidium cellare TaxID=395010 RepID=A0ABR0E810_ZASCE|nr:hypothetical protein PRZ48_011956 [Zasmidium cellare]
MSTKAVPTGPLADNISIASSDLVKILVGFYKAEEVSVHRDVICSTSEILKQSFASPDRKETTLPNILQLHFKIYVNWLYTGIIRAVEPQLGSLNEYTLLVQLFLTGATLKDKKFRNAIISVLLKCARDPPSGSKTLPDEDCINLAYNPAYNITGGGLKLLQKMLVEIYATEENPAYLVAVQDKVDRKFLSDLRLRLMEMRLAKYKNLLETRVCDFHEHKPKEQCEKQEPARKRRREE